MAEKDMKLALKVDDLDNVATIFANDMTDGMTVQVRDKKGKQTDVTIHGDVPYGHKIALCEIKKGEPIMKYGESIGRASTDIRLGDYVHVHNMEAMRGRGDLE